VSDGELEAKFRVRLEGKDELADFFGKSARGSERFAQDIGRNMERAGRMISGFANSARSGLSAFSGGGSSIASEARGVLTLRDAINQLAVQSGKGTEIVGGLTTQIHDVATASRQLQGDVTEALGAFVEKTGDLETARKNIELYGKTATATGAALKEVAQVGVELSDKLNVKDQANSFAILAAQAKAGAIELRDLATKGPRIFAAAASAGATGEMGVREAGALAQVYAKAFGGRGSAASVATAVENTFASLAKKRSALEGAGLKFTNADGSNRDRFEVLFDLIRMTKGDETSLRKVFTMQGMRGIEVLAREYRKTGDFKTFKDFRDVQLDRGLLDRDYATRANTGLAKLRGNEIARARFFEEKLGGAPEWVAENANALQLGLMGVGAWGKGISLGGSLLQRLGKGGLPGLSGAGGALASLGATPVRVVNWPNGGLGGVPGAGGGELGGAASALQKAGMVLAAGAAGYAAGSLIDSKLDLSGKIEKAMFELIHPNASQDTQAERRKKLEQESSLSTKRRGALASVSEAAVAAGLSTAPLPMKTLPGMEGIGINLTVNVDKDGNVTAESETQGVRSPKVMARRNAEGD